MPKEASTMSVPEMRKLLGLKKTESYWLVHKNCFKTSVVSGRMRIDKASFEEWYASQTHYRKVTGELPGENIRKDSFSTAELADLLSISTDSLYELLGRIHLDTYMIGHQLRISRASFEAWYPTQSHFRLPEDRERDRKAEETSMSIQQMGRLLGLDCDQAYKLAKDIADKVTIIVIAGRKRVTNASFEKWYSSQKVYRKTTGEKLLKQKSNSTFCSITEAAVILDLEEREIYRLIEYGDIHALKAGRRLLIRMEDIQNYHGTRLAE